LSFALFLKAGDRARAVIVLLGGPAHRRQGNGVVS
jgi:hypothetical protein